MLSTLMHVLPSSIRPILTSRHAFSCFETAEAQEATHKMPLSLKMCILRHTKTML